MTREAFRMSASLTQYQWADIMAESVAAGIQRKYITGEHVTVARFELKRGGVVPRHSHESEQLSMVMSGALLFKMGGRDVVVRAGEALQIPSWIEHEVDVLEDAFVIDVFSPVRQDWIDKTDDY